MCKKLVITKVHNKVVHYKIENKLGWSFASDFLEVIEEKGPFVILFKDESTRDKMYAAGVSLFEMLEAMGV
jgi:hypothetical protein